MVDFLHGAEVQEVDSGARTISTVKMSVIGIVVVAENSAAATSASLTLGSTALADDLNFTAVKPGRDGNAINITIVKATEESQTTSVSVTGQAITITLGNDSETSGNAFRVCAVVNASAEASALVTCTTTSTEEETEILDTTTKVFLENGTDEPFPLDTPVLVYGDEKYAEPLGTDTDAYKYIAQLMEQYGALVVVVRAKYSSDADEQKSNIINAIEMFKIAKAKIEVKPRILIAPGYSHDDAVGAKLESVSFKLRAISYLDMAMTASKTSAMQRTKLYGERVEVQWPWHKIWDTDLNQYIHMPSSVSAVGLRCRIDSEFGVHYSKSNNEYYNLSGTYEDVQWELSDKSSVANVLNSNKVSTTILASGFLHWGNRTCSNDSKWVFETSRRTIDMVNDSVESSMMWAVDRPGTTQWLQDVLESINNYLRGLKTQGVIVDGKAWLAEDVNTPDLMSQGVYYFDFDVGLYYPGEHLIFRSKVNNGYLEEVLNNV